MIYVSTAHFLSALAALISSFYSQVVVLLLVSFPKQPIRKCI